MALRSPFFVDENKEKEGKMVSWKHRDERGKERSQSAGAAAGEGWRESGKSERLALRNRNKEMRKNYDSKNWKTHFEKNERSTAVRKWRLGMSCFELFTRMSCFELFTHIIE